REAHVGRGLEKVEEVAADPTRRRQECGPFEAATWAGYRRKNPPFYGLGPRQLRLDDSLRAFVPGQCQTRRAQMQPEVNRDAEGDREYDVADPVQLHFAGLKQTNQRGLGKSGDRIESDRHRDGERESSRRKRRHRTLARVSHQQVPWTTISPGWEREPARSPGLGADAACSRPTSTSNPAARRRPARGSGIHPGRR